MEVIIQKEWKSVLYNYLVTEQFQQLIQNIRNEYIQYTVFPQQKDIFRAFELTPFSKVRAVILGQDPYHTPGVADGLSFSTNNGSKVPPSLQNIFKEIGDELYGEKYPDIKNPDLSRWATQGVLMLNNTLTVRAHTANSHQRLGWDLFTNHVITTLSKESNGLVFLLWGNFAGVKKSLIEPYLERNQHLILTSTHPSPFSARNGFFGNNHFIKTNEYLVKNGQNPIVW